MTIPEYTEKLLNTLKKHGIPERELSYRRNQLEKAAKLETENMGDVSDRYYQLAHEIGCFDFLSRFGNPRLSSDAAHTAGADIVLGKYQIECVCASPGTKTSENGFDKVCVKNNLGNMVDYSEREGIILCRLASVLKEKRDFFLRHCNNGSMSKEKPFVIFVGLGSLAVEFFAGENGIALLGILFGKGAPTLMIDSHGNVVGEGFEHRLAIKKRSFEKTVDIPCNCFLDDGYRCISGIIFTDKWSANDYNLQNTWLFINPFAENPISPDDFPGLTYWMLDENGEYSSYENQG